jgi:SAM-dependent methyltransferase
MRVFYSVDRAPAHSVLLMPAREQAINYPHGRIDLGFCSTCGFISNLSFDPGLHEYSSQYEETQGYSPTFNAFHRRLAEDLIERYGLRGKEVIEIGCGKGEFLSLLCEIGNNRGVGFDPSFVEGRAAGRIVDGIEFVKDFYSEKYADYTADFVCCKMTLEHIQDTAGFISTVRRSIGERRDTVVLFQVPEVTRIFQEIAFWDIYYEHCSYFSEASLGRLFARCGFRVEKQWFDYGNQYLMIEARPGDAGDVRPALWPVADVAASVATFEVQCARRLAYWKRLVSELRASGSRAVLWGGGSKAVAFLTTLGVTDEIPYAVDINPNKHGTYLAGSGQEIVAPEVLKQYKPELVILMNPMYRDEVGRSLAEMNVDADLVSVESRQEEHSSATLG